MASTPEPAASAAIDAQAGPHDGQPAGKYLALLSLSALGVVYGDIGTSPLYAMRECFHGPHAIPVNAANVLGILSLIFWSLVVIISGKYLVVVVRADNRGEGGMMALLSLLLKNEVTRGTRILYVLALFALFGSSLIYGEGLITPAISVLSAIEGLNVATHVFEPYVIPITLGILFGFFAIQHRGTGGVGKIFGPFTLVWFLTLAVLGTISIAGHPMVLQALNPAWAWGFFAENGVRGYLTLGTVFLVVTGGEALYADMGHFGRRPIRLAWFVIVLPSLLLNYFGQGALLLADPGAAEHPFYRLAPAWMVFPMVALATGATIIASQAMVSGAFSLTRQAVQLGYIPRIDIVHTSESEIGQIYIPSVNWFMCIAVMALVIGFRSSSNLAAAYGIAVASSMVITTILVLFLAIRVWKASLWIVLPLAAVMLTIDLAFFGANAVKIPQGAWFPVVIALGFFTAMTTWKRGREILYRRLSKQSIPLEGFVAGLKESPPHRVPGTAVFMSGNPQDTPVALMHNLKHNKVLHERVLFLTIVTEEVPEVPPEERVTLERIEPEELNMWRVVGRFGFMETPNVPEILGRCRPLGLELETMKTTFFLGRETLIPTKRRKGMALWREALFAAMTRNSLPATRFFKIPPNRVVELGSQVEI